MYLAEKLTNVPAEKQKTDLVGHFWNPGSETSAWQVYKVKRELYYRVTRYTLIRKATNLVRPIGN